MTSSVKNESSRFELLDLARGLAAFGILLFHSYHVPIFSTLYTFVDFFFVLSGFVLAPSYLRVNTLQEAKKFLINRAYRLFPTAFATLIFVLGIQMIVDVKYFVIGESIGDRVDTGFVTLVAAFSLCQIFSNSATLLNFPLWSLSAEWLSNFFVVTRPTTKRFNPPFLLIVGCLLIWHYQYSGNGWEEQLGRAMSGFYLGVLLRQRASRRCNGSWGGLIASSFIVLIMNIAIYQVDGKLSYLGPLAYGLVIIQLGSIAIRPNSRLSRVAFLVGRYSYGFYAWHFPLLSLSGILLKKTQIQFRLPPIGSTHLTVLLCVILTLVFTHLTLRYLDTPLRSYRVRKVA